MVEAARAESKVSVVVFILRCGGCLFEVWVVVGSMEVLNCSAGGRCGSLVVELRWDLSRSPRSCRRRCCWEQCLENCPENKDEIR